MCQLCLPAQARPESVALDNVLSRVAFFMEVKRQHNDPNLPVTAHQSRLCLSKGSSRRLQKVCKTSCAMYASCHLVSSDFALQPCFAALQAKRVLAASQHIHCEHVQGGMACGGTPTMAACAVASSRWAAVHWQALRVLLQSGSS